MRAKPSRKVVRETGRRYALPQGSAITWPAGEVNAPEDLAIEWVNERDADDPKNPRPTKEVTEEQTSEYEAIIEDLRNQPEPMLEPAAVPDELHEENTPAEEPEDPNPFEEI